VIAAEVGLVELAYDYLAEATLMDLHDLAHNTCDGLHIASLAGSWIAAVAGLGGMRDLNGMLSFAPRLPARLERLAFRLLYRGRCLKVEATPRTASYVLLSGEPLELTHHGDRITVTGEETVTCPIPPPPERPTPTQPVGRGPTPRSRALGEPTTAPYAANTAETAATTRTNGNVIASTKRRASRR
jgi:alpha,alpha-trehalose phosphorylase